MWLKPGSSNYVFRPFPLTETSSNPIFFTTVPDRKPRTECACQPVASISC